MIRIDLAGGPIEEASGRAARNSGVSHKIIDQVGQWLMLCERYARNCRRRNDYGYARVSTDGQTLASQEAALMQAGAAKVFAERVSGASVANRPALARALKTLGEGDVLLVSRLDRLARSTRDLLNVLDAVCKAGAGFRSLADAWADTTTPHGRLMLTVLGGLAEFERELIRARTGEGRMRAKALGVHVGRPPALDAHQRTGESLTDIAGTFGVSHTTISRLRADPRSDPAGMNKDQFLRS
jgi:DNA invertase Pin-like site-specific DNA recombinase